MKRGEVVVEVVEEGAAVVEVVVVDEDFDFAAWASWGRTKQVTTTQSTATPNFFFLLDAVVYFRWGRCIILVICTSSSERTKKQ